MTANPTDPSSANGARAALVGLIRSMQQDPMAAFDQSAVEKALKAAQKADKDLSKPVQKWVKAHGARPPPDRFLQACLESPALAPLRGLAASLLATGEVVQPVLTRLSSTSAPSRTILALHVATAEQRIYAAEDKGVVSV